MGILNAGSFQMSVELLERRSVVTFGLWQLWQGNYKTKMWDGQTINFSVNDFVCCWSINVWCLEYAIGYTSLHKHIIFRIYALIAQKRDRILLLVSTCSYDNIGSSTR